MSILCYGAILGSIVSAILGAIVGAIVGAIFGTILGAILGAILGSILGAILDAIHSQVAKVGMSHTSGMSHYPPPPFLIANNFIRVIIIPLDTD